MRARNLGETERRLYSLSGWRDSPLYSDRERAALELTEVLTKIGRRGVPTALYKVLRSMFTEHELINLALAIATINAWNRLTITFRPKMKDDVRSSVDGVRDTKATRARKVEGR